jgi:hypothetical protein
MKAEHSFENLGTTDTTMQCHIPEDRNSYLQNAHSKSTDLTKVSVEFQFEVGREVLTDSIKLSFKYHMKL